MQAQELCNMTMVEAGELFRKGALSPVELTQAHLERIGALEGRLNAYITVLEERALAQAHEAQRALASSEDRGPLHGIPLALKDLIYTRGIRTTAGSRILADFVPQEDATVAERLREAGAVNLGKLNLMEFAMGGVQTNVHYGPIHNPWNLDHSPGGSSSGAGAAVAAGTAMGALGTDTGGSIRSPASACGIVGLKPTYGRVSRHGVVPLSWSMDHVGPMARTVEECALMLQALAGHDHQDPASSPAPVGDYTAHLKEGIRGLRIGVLRGHFSHGLSEEVAQALEVAVGVLQELGAAVEDVLLERSAKGRTLYQCIVYPEATAYHLPWMRIRLEEYGENCRNRLEQGLTVPATAYLQAQQERRLLLHDFLDALERVDVLVLPGAARPAERLDASASSSWPESPQLSNPADLTGLPALCLPNGLSWSGLPLALQIVGRPFDEATVLRVADAYEQATPWHLRRPQVG